MAPMFQITSLPVSKIRGGNQEQPALLVLGCNQLDDPAIEIRGDHPLQRCAVHHGIAVDGGHDETPGNDVIGLRLRVHALEGPIEAAPQKGEGCRKRAGTRAGDDPECRPTAPQGPPHEQSGAKGAVLLPSRKREQVQRGGRTELQRLAQLCLQRGSIVGVEAGVGNLEKTGLACQGRRHSIEALRPGTAIEGREQTRDEQQTRDATLQATRQTHRHSAAAAQRLGCERHQPEHGRVNSLSTCPRSALVGGQGYKMAVRERSCNGGLQVERF